MLNADVFKKVFGIHAIDLWGMGDRDLLKWLNSVYKPQRTGRWIPWQPDKSGYAEEFYCSECGFAVKLQYVTRICNYKCCPNCLVKMGENTE